MNLKTAIFNLEQVILQFGTGHFTVWNRSIYNLGRSILQKCYVPNLYISIHYDIVAEASAHYEQVEDFMASEVFMPVVEDGKF